MPTKRQVFKDIEVFNLPKHINKSWTCWHCFPDNHIYGLVIVTRWPNLRSYHPDCYIKKANYTRYLIPSCTQEIQGFNSLKLCNKMLLINSLLPQYISIPYRYQLKIKKYNLNKLTDKELKKCLKQRDLKCYNNKDLYVKPRFERQVSLYSLATFLSKPECQDKHKCLVDGFCNAMNAKLSVTVPIVINKIVLRYCALYVLL